MGCIFPKNNIILNYEIDISSNSSFKSISLIDFYYPYYISNKGYVNNLTEININNININNICKIAQFQKKYNKYIYINTFFKMYIN